MLYCPGPQSGFHPSLLQTLGDRVQGGNQMEDWGENIDWRGLG